MHVIGINGSNFYDALMKSADRERIRLPFANANVARSVLMDSREWRKSVGKVVEMTKEELSTLCLLRDPNPHVLKALGLVSSKEKSGYLFKDDKMVWSYPFEFDKRVYHAFQKYVKENFVVDYKRALGMDATDVERQAMKDYLAKHGVVLQLDEESFAASTRAIGVVGNKGLSKVEARAPKRDGWRLFGGSALCGMASCRPGRRGSSTARRGRRSKRGSRV
jgi:hypothetical protein